MFVTLYWKSLKSRIFINAMIGEIENMNVKELDEYVIKVLKKNGWNEDRKYDADEWIKKLSAEGYCINEYAKEILCELGNINVRENVTEEHNCATFDFNPFYAASGEFDRMEEFEIASQEKMFPIGALQDYIMYASKSKKIYLGDWSSLYIAGDSIENFLNNMFKKVYEPKEINLKR